jgi:predicted ATPase
MPKRVVISGCSGGGKSTLLIELSRLGYGVVEEPGRRIIAEERETGGDAFPWVDAEAFVRRAIEMSLRDIDECSNPSQWVFFDRGLVDAASALYQITGEPLSTSLGVEHLYHRKVFLTPPWPEIYVTDADRRHQLSNAVEEYDRLLEVYSSIGYKVLIVPKTSVKTRADFVLEQLAQ